MQQHRLVKWRQLLRQQRSQCRRLRRLTRLRHSRSRAVQVFSVVVVSCAWLLLPLLAGCDRAENSSTTPTDTRSQAAPEDSNFHPISPSSAQEPASGSWPLRFTGLSHRYEGASRAQPNHELVHRKESYD